VVTVVPRSAATQRVAADSWVVLGFVLRSQGFAATTNVRRKPNTVPYGFAG